MKKRGPRGIPDFSRKKKSVPMPGLPEAKPQLKAQAPINVVKPHAASFKPGRRGQ